MLELTYKDKNNHTFKMRLDRTNHLLWESSIKTHDEYVQTKWDRLFDKGKERIQLLSTDKMTEQDFIKCLSYWFNARYGYTLKEIKNG